MSIKPENAKDKILLRDTKTGNLAGSVSTKGKDAPTVSSIDQKGNLTDHAKNVLEMKKAFKEIDVAAEAGDKKAIAQYDEARKKLDDALIALLPESIANLKLGDNITHTYLVTGPEWVGLRAEIKISDSIVNEKILATLRHGSFGQDDNLYTLLSITPTELEEKEISLEDAIDAQIDDWMKPRGISKESFRPDTIPDETPLTEGELEDYLGAILPGFANQRKALREGKSTPISDYEYPNPPRETNVTRKCDNCNSSDEATHVVHHDNGDGSEMYCDSCWVAEGYGNTPAKP